MSRQEPVRKLNELRLKQLAFEGGTATKAESKRIALELLLWRHELRKYQAMLRREGQAEKTLEKVRDLVSWRSS